ncbi:MAG: hypothetical protein A2750_00880 [Candidatus Yanofskybacteria bacterium RIFCSPHIGHO2_01_FULL_45_42]|uniref:Large ribosomal subunit protein uL15 n=3 Tax=Candidatus Yanofskyibacteriota TaxID=1752733 RepID=A0A1F8H5W6_9BACT|nr:MAG: hypothetical protein A2750_00880 [Candidatus Yanofskybacteria bacterium RIFCSPHIGHO2_01_FULL_45_42]OGN16331.1 MAG: hypothetical protein A3C81_02605 [Candidatus Yanofskybacteria bacterium RIFCSPHIGHO2_02_FULL_46_19]OGN27008.1 MAG: hypothetical protein A3B17_03225 [Candidatus Yanofskybacteria bacterium RIFCSPLOWO2_01_FULL_45_72]OGN32418.1 MAG: hypothetical protein A3J01_00675 [Candidatus Yanofskybacteria bacterium RIFCSPLOWO2_02_FULL_45_18]
MQLHQLQPNTSRRRTKYIGRGGKRGTTSGKGTKGQQSRAGTGIKPGFRGGDNRIWQQFPKQRGASSKPGNARPHHKHRFYQLRHDKMPILNLADFNRFTDGEVVTPALVFRQGLVNNIDDGVKVLADGKLGKKLVFEGFEFSDSAKEKVVKSGSTIK